MSPATAAPKARRLRMLIARPWWRCGPALPLRLGVERQWHAGGGYSEAAHDRSGLARAGHVDPILDVAGVRHEVRHRAAGRNLDPIAPRAVRARRAAGADAVRDPGPVRHVGIPGHARPTHHLVHVLHPGDVAAGER